MVKHVGKKGDTLVEVTLAVGIFSMVAISVVSVINGSTSSAQTALEATLTREEVDAQAEALRFIHDSASLDEPGGKYATLWGIITDPNNTLDPRGTSNDLSNYPPTTCSDLYNGGNAISDKAFVIDTHALGDPNVLALADPTNNIVIRKNTSFGEATTYPHLVYNNALGNAGSLAEEGTNRDYNLADVDGIYVIAVRDPGTIIAGQGTISAFYDFYIRTCWYGAGERKASTISTVIRLYDPTITQGE